MCCLRCVVGCRRCVGCCVMMTVQKKNQNDICDYRNNIPRENFSLQFYIYSKNISAPRKICNHFRRDGTTSRKPKPPLPPFFLFLWLFIIVDVYQCDDTIFSSRFEPEDCMRTFSQREPTRLLSSLQGANLRKQHRRRCHRIQGSIPPVSTSTHRKSRARSHVAQYRPNIYHP